MSACDSMLPLLLRAVDGTIGAGRAELDRHLASCASCREALAEQTTVSRLLAQMPMPRATPGFAAAVRERVAPRAGLLDLFNWRAWSLRLAPVAALLGILAWALSQPTTTSGTTSRATTLSATLEAWASGSGTRSTEAWIISADTDRDDLLAEALEGTR